MSQRGLASAFAAWSEQTLQMRGARQAMEQVAARMANRQLAAAFYSWQENAQQQLHARQTAHKLMLRFQQASQVITAATLSAASCRAGQAVKQQGLTRLGLVQANA